MDFDLILFTRKWLHITKIKLGLIEDDSMSPEDVKILVQGMREDNILEELAKLKQ